MAKTAIITGASSGLGREFARAVVDELPEIEEIWLIARRKERMEEIASRYPKKKFRILPYDLTSDMDLQKLNHALTQSNADIRLLVNNAGIVGSGAFESVDIKKQEAMIELNSKTPTVLINYVLPYMREGGMIVNVCSVAGFGPLPELTVYSSTKAYLLNLTKGLYGELKRKEIHILALCPGNMRTEMFTIPQNDGVTKKTKVEHLPFLDITKVAHKALDRAKRGKRIYTPRIFYKGYRFFAKLLPSRLIIWGAGWGV